MQIQSIQFLCHIRLLQQQSEFLFQALCVHGDRQRLGGSRQPIRIACTCSDASSRTLAVVAAVMSSRSSINA